MHRVQPRRRVRCQDRAFGMHAVLRVSSAVTGRKVPSPTCRVTASRAMPVASSARKQFRREMQARRGRRHRAVCAREQGLVVARIAGIRLALAGDIGRQRHLALRGNGRIQRRARQREGDFRLAGFAPRRHLGCKRAEFQRIAHRQLARRPRQHRKAVGRKAPVQQDFDFGRAGCRAGACPCSRAGITLVSLTTSASPRRR